MPRSSGVSRVSGTSAEASLRLCEHRAMSAGGRTTGAWLTCAAALFAVAIETTLVLRARLLDPGFPAIRVYGSALTGLMFVLCGLVAVWRTRYARMGWVLVAAGFLWMSEDLRSGHLPALFQISIYTQNASDFALALVVLSFPTGRVSGRASRFVL